MLKAVGERAVRRWMLPPPKPVGPLTTQAAFDPETDPKSQDWGLREPRGRGASPTLCPHPCRWEVAV